MGRAAEDGPFEDFMARVSAAEVVFDDLAVRYHAPGLGEVRFGWQGLLRVAGVEVALGGCGRYENPYARADFGTESISIDAGGHTLRLDWSCVLHEVC